MLIDRYFNLLGKAQRKEIESVMRARARAGEIRSQKDFSRALGEALSQISTSNLPITTVTPIQTLSRTDADIYNAFMQNFLIDIRALFRESNLSSYLMGLEEAQNKDFQDTAAAMLKGLASEYEARKFQLSSNRGYGLVYCEPFNDPGQKLFDMTELSHGELQLVPKWIESRSFDIEKIEILRYPRSGVTYVLDSAFDPVKNPSILMPGTRKGYWAETALVSEIPHMEFKDDPIIPINRRFDGILVLCRVTFTMPIPMNALDLDTYGEYPVNIPWLRYRASGSGAWKWFTSGSERISGSGSGHIYFRNMDRVLVKVLEIPVYQQSASLINTIVPQSSETYKEIMTALTNEDLRELENEISTFLSEKSDTLIYKNSIASLINSTEMDSAIKQLLSILGLSCRTIGFSTTGISGYQDTCNLARQVVTGDILQPSFVYGLYGITPMNIIYTSAGSYRSDEVNQLRRQIVSASVVASVETPDISSANFFLELEGGQRFSILPYGTSHVREHVPVIPDKYGLPRAYYTMEPGTSEFIPGTGVIRPVNRVIPSFYIDTTKEVKIFRNGIEIPSGTFDIDAISKTLTIDSAGVDLYSPLVVTDNIVVEYDVDPTYGPPGQQLENSPLVTESGVYIMTLISDIDISRNSALYVTLPTTQWFEVDPDFYTASNKTVTISGGSLRNYFSDPAGVSLLFEYYSFDEDFNGPRGRRDATGYPDRVDIIEGSSKVINSRFTIVSSKYTGKFRIFNGLIDLPHQPLIDFNLYNYDGTWIPDPETGQIYYPLMVKIGSPPQEVLAIDVTPYKLDEIPNLIPFSEIGIYLYYLSGNRIFFNVVESDLDVTISYEYIPSNTRLCVELHTNRPGGSLYTPIVEEYSLHLGMV